MKKAFALLAAAVLLTALTLCAPAEEAVLRPRLVSRVTEYEIDFETGEWAPVRTWDFTYENGYPVSVDLHELDTDAHLLTTCAYEFADGLPLRRSTWDADGALLSVTEYNAGRVYNILEQGEGRTNAAYFQYGNGDGYFTLVLRDERGLDPEDPEGSEDHAEEVDAVSVTAENGLLVKTVNTGMYANWSSHEEKEWLRFSGTYTTDYDGDGIAALASAVHRDGPSGVDARIEVTKAEGLVTQGTVYTPTAEGGWYGLARFTFAYTDLEISPARYARMINSFLMGSESPYYIYHWY